MTNEPTDTAAHDVEAVLEKLEGQMPTKVIGRGRHGDTIIDDDREAIEQERREAASLIRQLRDEVHYANGVAELAMKHRDDAEAELDALKHDIERYVEISSEEATRAEAAEAEVSSLRARVVELEKALEPFIAHYQLWMDEWPSDEPCHTYPRLTFGALRTARAVRGGSDAGH